VLARMMARLFAEKARQMRRDLPFFPKGSFNSLTL
jgi:hypothetical protein